MRFMSPTEGQSFTIAPGGDAPSIDFASDASGAHVWDWSIRWGSHHQSGQARTPDNRWDARAAIANLGGTLDVRARSAGGEATITARIVGANPSPEAVTRFLAAQPGSDGFTRIVAQESRYRHFDAHGEPVRAFDGGCGLCQLTTPAPTFAQAWSWKRNLEAGLALFAAKRAAAHTWLGQSGRIFTGEQLTREAVCRWNGGRYHVWDGARWSRPATIVCDTRAGNIGWDMGDPANHGHSEAALHARDAASYARPPLATARWHYHGVCYADHVLGPPPALSGSRAISAARAPRADGSRAARVDARTRPPG